MIACQRYADHVPLKHVRPGVDVEIDERAERRRPLRQRECRNAVDVAGLRRDDLRLRPVGPHQRARLEPAGLPVLARELKVQLVRDARDLLVDRHSTRHLVDKEKQHQDGPGGQEPRRRDSEEVRPLIHHRERKERMDEQRAEQADGDLVRAVLREPLQKARSDVSGSQREDHQNDGVDKAERRHRRPRQRREDRLGDGRGERRQAEPFYPADQVRVRPDRGQRHEEPHHGDQTGNLDEAAQRQDLSRQDGPQSAAEPSDHHTCWPPLISISTPET